MNSLKKGEGVPLLNFEGGPGILLLNFEGDPGVPLLNFEGGLRCRVPGSWSHFYAMQTRKTLKRLQDRCFIVNIAEFFYGTPPVAASAVLKNSYIPRKTSVAEA